MMIALGIGSLCLCLMAAAWWFLLAVRDAIEWANSPEYTLIYEVHRRDGDTGKWVSYDLHPDYDYTTKNDKFLWWDVSWEEIENQKIAELDCRKRAIQQAKFDWKHLTDKHPNVRIYCRVYLRDGSQAGIVVWQDGEFKDYE